MDGFPAEIVAILEETDGGCTFAVAIDDDSRCGNGWRIDDFGMISSKLIG